MFEEEKVLLDEFLKDKKDMLWLDPKKIEPKDGKVYLVIFYSNEGYAIGLAEYFERNFESIYTPTKIRGPRIGFGHKIDSVKGHDAKGFKAYCDPDDIVPEELLKKKCSCKE